MTSELEMLSYWNSTRVYLKHALYMAEQNSCKYKFEKSWRNWVKKRLRVKRNWDIGQQTSFLSVLIFNIYN